MQAKPTVFISYRREFSADLARYLHDRLTDDGVDVFYDLDDLQGGDRWRERLTRELVGREYLLVLLAQDTLNRSLYVREEIKTALDLNMKIIPVTHDGFYFNTAVIPPEIARLSEFTGIAYDRNYANAAYDKIKRALKIETTNPPQAAKPAHEPVLADHIPPANPEPEKPKKAGLLPAVARGVVKFAAFFIGIISKDNGERLSKWADEELGTAQGCLTLLIVGLLFVLGLILWLGPADFVSIVNCSLSGESVPSCYTTSQVSTGTPTASLSPTVETTAEVTDSQPTTSASSVTETPVVPPTSSAVIPTTVVPTAVPAAPTSASSGSTDFRLLVDDVSFTLVVTASEAINLNGLQFRVLEADGDLRTESLAEYFDVLALTSGMVQPGSCLVLNRPNTSASLATACNRSDLVYRPNIAQSDVFWFDFVNNVERDVTVLHNEIVIGSPCSAVSESCDFQID